MSVELGSDVGGYDSRGTVKPAPSLNAKRRLRRMRLTAARAGVVVPYEPISQPPDNDGPKLTNTAKRMARKRKKFALECEALGEDEVRSRIKALSKDKKKKRRKRESSKFTVCKVEIKSEKSNRKDNQGHIRFSDGDDDDGDKPEDVSAKIEEEEDESMDESNRTEIGKTAVNNTGVVAKDEKKLLPNKPAKKMRFVLFVGNLSYDTTAEDIKVHFFKVGPILDIRMAKYLEEDKKDKCRGFCHLEVKDEETYLKALSMHHSYLAKRRINVEYSDGQTKEKKVEQKQKKAKFKEMIKSGDMHEILNPTHGASKAVRRTTAKRNSQKQGNQFWV